MQKGEFKASLTIYLENIDLKLLKLVEQNGLTLLVYKYNKLIKMIKYKTNQSTNFKFEAISTDNLRIIF